MTMEDVAELAWYVQQHGLTAEALRLFERERIPRVSRIVKKAQVRRRRLSFYDSCKAQHPVVLSGMTGDH